MSVLLLRRLRSSSGYLQGCGARYGRDPNLTAVGRCTLTRAAVLYEVNGCVNYLLLRKYVISGGHSCMVVQRTFL